MDTTVKQRCPKCGEKFFVSVDMTALEAVIHEGMYSAMSVPLLEKSLRNESVDRETGATKTAEGGTPPTTQQSAGPNEQPR